MNDETSAGGEEEHPIKRVSLSVPRLLPFSFVNEKREEDETSTSGK